MTAEAQWAKGYKKERVIIGGGLLINVAN